MSGIEVAGLLLGAFPLVISAMEHYEDVKKVSSTWWRIKRAHKKDLGRVKDCHLKFRLNLKELLLPLVLDGVVNTGEYESLLANPGGAGWKEDHVESALGERLTECHTRYVETLKDMIETMGRLSRACRVEDADFQDVLRRRGEVSPHLQLSRLCCPCSSRRTSKGPKPAIYTTEGLTWLAILAFWSAVEVLISISEDSTGYTQPTSADRSHDQSQHSLRS